MKKIVIYSALVTALALTGCSDMLNIQPVGSVQQTTLLNKNGIDMSLTATYARLRNNSYFEASVTNYPYGDVLGGDANKGSNFSDQPDFTAIETYAIAIDNSYFHIKWRREYDGVFRSNNLLSMIDQIQEELSTYPGDGDKDYYTEVKAEALFLRAHHMFEVVKLFGAAVPFVSLEDFVNSSTPDPQVSNTDESGNYVYVWDRILEDLQFAYDNLPETRTVSGQYTRTNKWAAAALMAKVLVYQSSPYTGNNGGANRWAEAKSLLGEIVANGTDSKGTKYRLATTYEELYTAGESDWTGESVFDVQTSIAGTVTEYNVLMGAPHVGMSGALGLSGWGFYQPSNDFVNAHIVDANGLPLKDGSFRNMETLTKAGPNGANYPVVDLAVYTDPRLDYNVGRFHTPFLDYGVPIGIDGWIREVTNGGYYVNKKPIPKKADRGSLAISNQAVSSAKNYHIIRYADVLLLYAETLIETGDLAGARELINTVRARAANSYLAAADESSYILDDKVNNTTKAGAAGNYRIGLWPESQFANKEGALTALRWERRIELGMEGHHWYDLVRWGIAGEELNKFTAFEGKWLSRYTDAKYDAGWAYMPIPLNEINTMQGRLKQNDAWGGN